MGKQVKGWTPPEDDEVVVETTAQENTESKPTQQWTPPAEDEVITEPVKKKRLYEPISFFERLKRSFRAFWKEYSKYSTKRRTKKNTRKRHKA